MLKLVMAFHDQSPAYAYGFEAGKLYGEMGANRRVIEGIYHECNHQQLLLCAQTHQYRVVAVTSMGDGYMQIRFEKPLRQWAIDLLKIPVV